MSIPAKAQDCSSNRFTHILVYVVFFLSGAAALIYEISWSRQLGLLFGHTVHAASVVLASYFAGMAIGYWLGAKWSTRVSPLFGYGIAELVVAGWAFVIPILLSVSESSTIAPWMSHSSFAWQTTSRVIFSLLLLMPGTISLGATLPFMAAYLSGGRASKMENPTDASRVSLAYALNTAGALVGVLSATCFLLLTVGVSNSSYLAAVLSVICACGAFSVQHRGMKTGYRNRNQQPESESMAIVSPDVDLIASQSRLWVFSALSGFGTLALQVLYTRMFSLVFHNSTYTFGIVVAVFLASLALGAALVSALQRRFKFERQLGVILGLGSLCTINSVLVFVFLTELKYFGYGESFAVYMTGALLLVGVVVGPPITCLGMVLPLVWKLAGDSDSTGKVVGKLTAVNTIAAATGALAASFCMLPWVGLWQSMTLISAMFFLAAFHLFWSQGQKRLAGIFAGLLVVTAVFVLTSPTESEYDRVEQGEHLVKRWSSAYGWIDVVKHEATGALKIRQNLHYRFGKTGSNAREFRQASIPLLLHKKPQDVLFLGLGTGLTAGGAIPHVEVKNIVAVELIPEVVQAVRLLSKFNNNLVDHPRVKIFVDDARHHLLAHDRQFDVIVSDLFVPWESESGYLYTVEHYQVAMERLKPGGLFCQWLPLFQLGTREFESIANSFSSVFPHTTIWWAKLDHSSPVIALIGTRSPLDVNAQDLTDRLDELQQRRKYVDPTIATAERFWEHYLGDWILQPHAQFNTDEHPRVEFLTPISNRNRQMIRGQTLEQYYDLQLSQLPAEAARLSGGDQESIESRSGRQRFMLFGK